MAAEAGYFKQKSQLKEKILNCGEMLRPLDDPNTNYGPPSSVAIYRWWYIRELKKLTLELNILELRHEIPEFESDQAVASTIRTQASPQKAKLKEARKKLGSKQLSSDSWTT